MFRFFVAAYPWDLVDDDVGRVLDRLHGEVGVTGVSVWVGLPPLAQLRVRDVQPRVFRTRGGLFFHPDNERYAATRCRPIVSGWAKTRQPLVRLTDACRERGMATRAIVSAARTGRVAERHPEMACKNALEAESHVSLCLANPDVQTYLCSLVSDLSANDGLSGVTVTDFAITWAEAAAGGVVLPSWLGETEVELLSTCFCESCHQRAFAAGVDVGRARRSAQTILQQSLDRGLATEARLESILADSEPLTDFARWRANELSSLLGRLGEACRCELLLDRCVDGPARGAHAELDLSVPAAVITRLGAPDQLTDAFCQAARRNELRLPEIFATGSSAPDLVRITAQAVEAGFSGIEIDNYGLLPDTALTPIKQAVRFARRSVSD